MKVLITGREGQLVRSLLERGRESGHQLIALGRPDLNLEQAGSAADTVRRVGPDVIVSAAAYTAVDQAEDEPERARQVNGEAPGELAQAAHAIGAPIIHFSTDYVFDGSSPEPYREDDRVRPLSVYGITKHLGEERVRAATPNHLIIRTAWVYSPFGRNFVKTMMRLAESREEIGVVADQRGNPTSALDLADGILSILDLWREQPELGLGETYHLAGTGAASWCEFADQIFAECRKRGLPAARVRSIATSDFPTRAIRPAFSLLDSDKFLERFGYRAQNWRSGLQQVMDGLTV